MKVLLLAPQPYYQLRRASTAVERLVETFSRRGWHVDLLTPHEGFNVEIPGVRVIRIPRIPWTRSPGPDFPLKKAVCDLWLFAKAVQLLWREPYDLIHAVDESAFIGVFFWRTAGCPFTYGMDSCMSARMTESHPGLRWLLPILQGLELFVFRNAYAVLAACDILGAYARAKGARHVMVLPDAPPCAPPEPEAFARAMGRPASDASLRAHLGERALHVARTRSTTEGFDRTALGFCDLAERLLLWDGFLCRHSDGVY